MQIRNKAILLPYHLRMKLKRGNISFFNDFGLRFLLCMVLGIVQILLPGSLDVCTNVCESIKG